MSGFRAANTTMEPEQSLEFSPQNLRTLHVVSSLLFERVHQKMLQNGVSKKKTLKITIRFEVRQSFPFSPRSTEQAAMVQSMTTNLEID